MPNYIDRNILQELVEKHYLPILSEVFPTDFIKTLVSQAVTKTLSETSELILQAYFEDLSSEDPRVVTLAAEIEPYLENDTDFDRETFSRIFARAIIQAIRESLAIQSVDQE